MRTPQEILTEACAETGYSVEDICGRVRTKHLVAARKHVALRLRAAGFSYPEAGRLLGKRDHTSMMHLCKTGGDAAVKTRLRVVA